MYKLIFELVNEPLGLPISAIYEYIILLVLNEIAFQIAWNLSPGGKRGSEVHWLIRIPTFLIVWAITYIAIAIANWVISNWVIIVSIILGIIVISGIAIYIFKHQGKQTQ